MMSDVYGRASPFWRLMPKGSELTIGPHGGCVLYLSFVALNLELLCLRTCETCISVMCGGVPSEIFNLQDLFMTCFASVVLEFNAPVMIMTWW
jgi:hypothetical protein